MVFDTHRLFHKDCKMGRKIEMVGRLVNMHEHDDTAEDIIYWLKKSPSDRLHAVTFLTAQSLPGSPNEIKTEVIDAKQVIYPLFERFYKLLNLHEVQYLTIGGYAMAYFGMPRFSDDLDIWVNPSQENMSLLSSALIGLGPSLMMDAILQDNPGDGSVKFGTKPMAVDIHLNLPELEFQSAFANRELVQVSDVQIPFISKNDFVASKLSSNRIQDITDGKIIQSSKGR